MKEKKVVLYGAGKRCKVLCEILQELSVRIMAIVDSNPDKWGEYVGDYRVENPQKILELQDAHLCITVINERAAEEIRKELQVSYRYDLQKEIRYNRLIFEAYIESPVTQRNLLMQSAKMNAEEEILFDSFVGLGLGGVETWTLDICGALLRDGNENVYIISNGKSYDIPQVIEKHVIPVAINDRGIYSLESVMSYARVIMEKLPCKVITRAADVVMLAAYLVKRCYPGKIEIISVVHGSKEEMYSEYMDFRECPDVYVGVSVDIKNDIIRKGIGTNNVYSMTCPFPCEPVLTRMYTEDSLMPICIGYAGRMDGMTPLTKRMDLLLKLAKRLREKKINFRMELAGEGPVLGEMKKFVYHNNLDKNVKFLGKIRRAEIPSFWKRQDICVNISDSEGRCISIIEAMGNGAVPVVTATSGVREDITDGVNGFIIPLGDFETMAERIIYLSHHRERLSEMGGLAHDVVYPKSLMQSHLEFWKSIFSEELR